MQQYGAPISYSHLMKKSKSTNDQIWSNKNRFKRKIQEIVSVKLSCVIDSKKKTNEIWKAHSRTDSMIDVHLNKYDIKTH